MAESFLGWDEEDTVKTEQIKNIFNRVVDFYVMNFFTDLALLWF